MARARCYHCGIEAVHLFNGGHCPRCLLGAALNVGVPSLPQPVAFATTKRPPPLLGSFCAYRLLEKIACGGMGVVYKARQMSLRRIVAIKMLLDGTLATEADLHRFRCEAELVAYLQHPNIIAVHDLGEQNGHCYFCMDYIEGVTLGELARARPLPGARAARYVKAIAQAMHYAHGQGVVHRDLKPSNILIDSLDQPRITDFGLAKRSSLARASELRRRHGDEPRVEKSSLCGRRSPGARSDTDLTLAGQIVGSPGYMSPEQAAGNGAVDYFSDIYSIGAILYYLLTSRPPFSADTVPTTLRLVREQAPVPPQRINQEVPSRLEGICLKCLEKQPRHRYRSAGELALELGSFLDQTANSVRQRASLAAS